MADLLDRLQVVLRDRYRLERELGQGGMATVYLAEDLRHHRRVAVKVLRPELAAVIGAERFLTEIRTTANLQHPHILPLFDSGRTGGDEAIVGDDFLYYVMPYVEGESLRDRLSRDKQLPIRDAVRIASEVASALDYAHRHGVIHRDIKPENILLHDGSALVADFGIALAASKAGTRMTETGMSLGTPHYMSPEQAMGEREIGPASDVYALGAVTYEMLTGDPPFTGSTAQAIVARVVTEHPRPLSAQRHTIPAHVESAVLTALEKLPADRFASAAEFAAALAGARIEGRTTAETPRARARAAHAALSRPGAGLLAGVLVLVALAAAAGWMAARARAPRPVVARMTMQIPAQQQLPSINDPIAALSPSGDRLVYTASGEGGVSRLYLRTLDGLAPVVLPGTENACCPVFSPDGNAIAFADISTGAWKRMSANGGAPVAIPVRAPHRIVMARWAGSAEFMASLVDGSLGLVRADGSVEVLARPDSAAGEQSLDVMEVLPDGSALAVALTSFPNGNVIVVGRNGRRHAVPVGVVNWAGWSAGHLIWSPGGGGLLNAARMDPGSGALEGPVMPLGIAAQQTRGSRPRIAQPARAHLAYVPAQPLTLVEVNRQGQVATLLGLPRSYHNPRLSPDGTRIAFDFEEGTRDVWILEREDTTITRATFTNDGHDAEWLPDGSGLIFASVRGGRIGIFRRLFGNDEPDSVLVDDGPQTTAHAITPDGRTAIVVRFPGSTSGTDGNGSDIGTMPLAEGGALSMLMATRFDEAYPALSPDGRWLAYVSSEAGRPDVYLRPFGTRGNRILISPDGGSEPVWSRDGRELFYRTIGTGDPQLVSAVIATSPALRVVSRTPLFSVGDYEPAVPHANYDVLPDRRSFVMVRQGRLAEFVYVQNWAEELEQR
ncbi:MAG TPA: protein kinase [Gemmatimonadales bacterium]|nr:protein kinase [Gemmatimonadales bacterium]